MDLFDKFVPKRTPLRMLTVDEGPLDDEITRIAERYFLFPELSGPINNRMSFNGSWQVVWSVNNYLGIAAIPEIVEQERESAEKWGLSYPMGARMFSGDTFLHRQLEKDLAEYTQKEACNLFNYGYQGMTSMIDCLLDIKDVVIYDSQSHACIVDGVRLHAGKRLSFLHNRPDNLRRQLEQAVRITDKSGGGILVITEGVFGMSGEQGTLKEIVDLKKDFEFRLLVDDAHGFGVMGETGFGTGEAQGCQDGIDLFFGTFAKAFASIGAFVSGDKHAVDFVRYGIRSQMFAKTLPMIYVENNLHRLRYMRAHPELRERMWKNARALQSGLTEAGFNLAGTNSQITPVFLSCEVQEGANMLIDLRENYHVFCSGALFPVVPRGVFLLRLIPTAAHTDEDVALTLNAFKECKNKLDSGYYKQRLPAETLDRVLHEGLLAV